MSVRDLLRTAEQCRRNGAWDTLDCARCAGKLFDEVARLARSCGHNWPEEAIDHAIDQVRTRLIIEGAPNWVSRKVEHGSEPEAMFALRKLICWRIRDAADQHSRDAVALRQFRDQANGSTPQKDANPNGQQVAGLGIDNARRLLVRFQHFVQVMADKQRPRTRHTFRTAFEYNLEILLGATSLNDLARVQQIAENTLSKRLSRMRDMIRDAVTQATQDGSLAQGEAAWFRQFLDRMDLRR